MIDDLCSQQLLLLLLVHHLVMIHRHLICRWHLLLLLLWMVLLLLLWPRLRSTRLLLHSRTRLLGGCPLSQTLLREIDGLRLRHRAIRVVRLLSSVRRRWLWLLLLLTLLGLLLLLIVVHALLRCHRHVGLQLARQLHVLTSRHLQK